MASINDNLFTILQRYATPQEIDCRILTQWGPVRACFSNFGLTHLFFEPQQKAPIETDSVFRQVFLDWLQYYQSLSPSTQWQYLAPAGTPFQKSVWRALLDLPCAERAAYKSIALRIGQPTATRAVASAIAANPICLLIPCHRIVKSSGAIGNYRWGVDRKLALLDAEAKASTDLVQLFK